MLPKQYAVTAAVPTARQQCAKHSSTVRCAARAQLPAVGFAAFATARLPVLLHARADEVIE